MQICTAEVSGVAGVHHCFSLPGQDEVLRDLDGNLQPRTSDGVMFNRSNVINSTALDVTGFENTTKIFSLSLHCQVTS